MASTKKTCYKANNIANYLIFLASQENQEKERDGITNLKLQKMLYFSQAYYLAMFDKPLFKEKIEAWEYGPVVREVYDNFKKNKSNPITIIKDESVIKEEDKEIIRRVWNIFGAYSASRLVEIVHSHTPWKDANISRDRIISNKMIKDYYSPLLNKK